MKIRNFIKQHFEKALQRGYIPMFAAAAKAYDFPLALLMAIASRETNMTNMKGDYRFNTRLGRKVYNGYGILQVDINTDENWCLSGGWQNVAEAIMHGTKILDEKRDDLNRRWQGQRTLQQFLWTLAASYNTGVSRAYPNFIASGNPDKTTTGHDYGRDVLGRMVEFMELLKERNLDVAATKIIPAATVTPDHEKEETWTTAPVPNNALPVASNAAGAGSLVIQTGEENTVQGGSATPVTGGGVNDPVQTVPTSETERTGSQKSWLAALGAGILAAITYLIENITAAFGYARAAFSDNPTGTLVVVCVFISILVIYWKYQDRQTQLDKQREQQAHERDMANLKALQDPSQINAVLVPPSQLRAFTSEIGKAVMPYSTTTEGDSDASN